MSSRPHALGKVQLRIMQILWARGSATAREITDVLSETDNLAHSTIQTLLRKMETKGVINHEIDDRTFRFIPLIQEHEITKNAAHDLLTRMFKGSAFGLVSHLLSHEDISSEEMSRIRELLNKEAEK